MRRHEPIDCVRIDKIQFKTGPNSVQNRPHAVQNRPDAVQMQSRIEPKWRTLYHNRGFYAQKSSFSMEESSYSIIRIIEESSFYIEESSFYILKSHQCHGRSVGPRKISTLRHTVGLIARRPAATVESCKIT